MKKLFLALGGVCMSLSFASTCPSISSIIHNQDGTYSAPGWKSYGPATHGTVKRFYDVWLRNGVITASYLYSCDYDMNSDSDAHAIYMHPDNKYVESYNTDLFHPIFKSTPETLECTTSIESCYFTFEQ